MRLISPWEYWYLELCVDATIGTNTLTSRFGPENTDKGSWEPADKSQFVWGLFVFLVLWWALTFRFYKKYILFIVSIFLWLSAGAVIWQWPRCLRRRALSFRHNNQTLLSSCGPHALTFFSESRPSDAFPSHWNMLKLEDSSLWVAKCVLSLQHPNHTFPVKHKSI